MFFFLSKILDTLVTPLAWSVALLVFGLVRPEPRWRSRAASWAGIAVLLVFSLEPVSNALFAYLERAPRRTARPDVTYDVVILLGGVAEERIQGTWGERAYNENNERLLETFDLLRTGRAKYAIVSGGPANVDRPELTEANVLVDQLTRWGIDPGRLVVEGEAKNTHENAVDSAAIVRARGWQTVLIVTSAFHMPRAYGCFVVEGLPVDTLPVDFKSYGGRYRGELIPRATHLERSSAALRELFGRLTYRLRGYSR